jgi:quercetin dioxygenase-like cupin family protein
MGLELGASTGEQLYQHDGEESGVVMDGAIRLMVGTQDFVLQKGDSFRFASTIPHGFANAAEGQSTVLWVNATRSTSAG